MALNDEGRKRAKEAADYVVSFPWAQTPQGGDFWLNVHRELMKVVDEYPLPAKPNPTKRNYTDDEKKCMQEVADKLSKAFIWTDTPEGDDYWRKIHDRLVEMASDD